MTFNPYQENEEYERSREEKAKNLFKKGVGIATSYLGGTSLINRILPLLSSHIPEKIAVKGIEKVSPKLGQFVESASNLGHDFYEVRDFLRAKVAEENDNKKNEEKKNIVKQYSPDLDQFLMEQIGKGRSPLEAGALASQQDRFKSTIKKITKDHKATFADIMELAYGKGEASKPQNSQEAMTQNISKSAQRQQGGELSRQGLVDQFQQSQGNGGKAALAQTMKEITELFRGMRG